MRAEFNSPSSIAGRLQVPASKSYTHRAYLVAALLAGGTVNFPLECEDTAATRSILPAFSARCEQTHNRLKIDSAASPELIQKSLFAGESGTLLRFLLPLCTVLPGPEQVVISGEGSLPSRSNKEVLTSIRDNGFEIKGSGEAETVPVTCFPGQALPDSPVEVTARTTSQLVSGWLITLSALGGGKLEIVGPTVSSPYIEMTLQVLRRAGVEIDQPTARQFIVRANRPEHLDYTVPGDYSSAAFFLVGGALTPGQVSLEGLQQDDLQADRKIISILENLGAKLERVGKTTLDVSGPFSPPGFTVDAGNCPDLVPILAVLGAFSGGEVEITNIAHLANKESDRLNTTCRELAKTGLQTEALPDKLIVRGDSGNFSNKKIVFNAHNDHRLAMAFSVFSLVRGNCVVEEAEAVKKSYPHFYEDLKQIGVDFELNNA